jgi:hypothetical protein
MYQVVLIGARCEVGSAVCSWSPSTLDRRWPMGLTGGQWRCVERGATDAGGGEGEGECWERV